MIGIAIRTFIIDFGLNIMFDRIINNFNTLSLVKHTKYGYLYIDDNERITDEQIIGWLKEKRDD